MEEDPPCPCLRGRPIAGELDDQLASHRDGLLTLVLAPRAQADGGLVLSDGSSDGVEDLEREPRAVLNRAAVLVRPLVRDVLVELVD